MASPMLKREAADWPLMTGTRSLFPGCGRGADSGGETVSSRAVPRKEVIIGMRLSLWAASDGPLNGFAAIPVDARSGRLRI